MRVRGLTRVAAAGAAVVLAVGGTAFALGTSAAQAADSAGGLPACIFWASGITPPARSDTAFTPPLQAADAVNFSARMPAPALTGSFLNGQVSLTVSRVPGAVAYRIWRDGVAVAWISDWGQATLTAVDRAPCKGAYYTVVAMGDNSTADASMGRLSVPYWLGDNGVVAAGMGPVPPGTTITMMVTAYNDIGPTATGYTSGLGICAVDPRVIPWGSYFMVPGYGTCFAGDIGTWIQKDTVDVWLPGSQANGWGVQHRPITVVANPFGSGSGFAPIPTASRTTSSRRSTPLSRTLTPTLATSLSPTTSPTSARQYPAWVPNHAYLVGGLVSYAGHNYECLQSHTSLVTWEPPNAPALWQPVS